MGKINLVIKFALVTVTLSFSRAGSLKQVFFFPCAPLKQRTNKKLSSSIKSGYRRFWLPTKSRPDPLSCLLNLGLIQRLCPAIFSFVGDVCVPRAIFVRRIQANGSFDKVFEDITEHSSRVWYVKTIQLDNEFQSRLLPVLRLWCSKIKIITKKNSTECRPNIQYNV